MKTLKMLAMISMYAQTPLNQQCLIGVYFKMTHLKHDVLLDSSNFFFTFSEILPKLFQTDPPRQCCFPKGPLCKIEESQMD